MNNKVMTLQIDAFRRLRSDHGRITHNFRPLQPIGDRTVLYNTERNGYFDNSMDGYSHRQRDEDRPGKGNSPAFKQSKLFIAAIIFLISLLHVDEIFI